MPVTGDITSMKLSMSHKYTHFEIFTVVISITYYLCAVIVAKIPGQIELPACPCLLVQFETKSFLQMFALWIANDNN